MDEGLKTKLTGIEAIWSENPDDENSIKWLKNIEVNIDLISEKYTSEDGEKVIIMTSGNEYIVKDFKFLENQ